MSTLYELALKGLGEREQYAHIVQQYLNTYTETKIEKDTNDEGLVIFNNLMTIYFDEELMDFDYYKKSYGFDAEIVLNIYFFTERYETGVDVLLQLAAYLETLGVEYLFEEGSLIFRKENGKLDISLRMKDNQYYLNEETIRRFLK